MFHFLIKSFILSRTKYVKNRNNICTFYRVIVYETYYLNSPGKHLLPHDAVIRWIKILELFYHFYMQIIYWFECNNIYIQILLYTWKREGKINKNFPNKFRRLIVEYLSIYNIYIYIKYNLYIFNSLVAPSVYNIENYTYVFISHRPLILYNVCNVWEHFYFENI